MIELCNPAVVPLLKQAYTSIRFSRSFGVHHPAFKHMFSG